jgi:hypothetical protein
VRVWFVAAVCAVLLAETIGLSSWTHEDEQCCADAQFDGCDDCSCCTQGPVAAAAAEGIVAAIAPSTLPLVSLGTPEAPEPREILHVPRQLGA